jgi:uncharacterized protein YprB with RNaseH-like and TPR domain
MQKRLPSLPEDWAPRGPVVYLDIETTGLSASTAHVTVVGLVFREGNGRRLRQYFVQDRKDEGRVLRAVLRELDQFAGSVTYNGRGFDLPFLRRRAWAHEIRWPWIETLDLLPVARRWRRLHGCLPNCQLHTVMHHFGLRRTDDTSGAEMVNAYERWLETGDTDERDIILEHNADDVLLLPDVVPYLAAPLRMASAHVRERRLPPSTRLA